MLRRPRKHVALEVHKARLAQSAERKALNLVVVGSRPTVGEFAGRTTCFQMVEASSNSQEADSQDSLPE